MGAGDHGAGHLTATEQSFHVCVDGRLGNQAPRGLTGGRVRIDDRQDLDVHARLQGRQERHACVSSGSHHCHPNPFRHQSLRFSLAADS